MIPPWVSFLFALLAEWYSARRDAQIRFLKVQLQIARDHLPGNRVVLSPEERVIMLRAGKELNHRIHDVLDLVEVKTCRRWVREERDGKTQGGSGAPD